MKELEITFRIRNNRLKERREKLGLTITELSRRCEISPTTYCHLEGLSPRRLIIRKKDGQWSIPVLKLAKFFSVEPAELFPASTITAELNKARKKIDGADVPGLLSGSNMLALPDEVALNPEEQIIRHENKQQLDEIIENHFTDRQKYIWEKHFLEGRQASEVAKELQISATRVGQISTRCLRKIRFYRRKMKKDSEVADAVNRAVLRKKKNYRQG